MFLITNRSVKDNGTTVKAFGDRPSELGPNELRAAQATYKQSKWKIKVLKDVQEITVGGKKMKVPASEYIAHSLLQRGVKTSKDLLLFVHGFNNDVKAVLDRARRIERAYGVEVLAFSWPANGGGGAKGAASYLSDKQDARASVGALYRVIKNVGDYINKYRKKALEDCANEAKTKHPGNAELQNAYFAEQVEKFCPFTVNLLLHSMGNYLYKNTLMSSTYGDANFMFDNVVLAAADTNSARHKDWVDKIPFRNRLYITINEKDVALRASRLKFGEQQKARLGHYPFELQSENASYVDFTGASQVKKAHAYFEGGPLNNATVKRFFKQALTGQVAESRLKYDPARNLYKIRGA